MTSFDREQETQLKSLEHTWINQKSPQIGKPTRGFGPVFGWFKWQL